MSRWIFLRGLTRERRHWGDFPEAFGAAIPAADVLTLDLPGNGARYRETSPASIAGLLAACRDDLAARRIDPPYHLLALSLGAMVAVDWARRYPQEVRGAVLINTSLRPFSRFFRRLKPANYPTLARLALGGGSAHAREGAILRLTSRRVTPPSAILDDWIAWRREFPVTRLNAARQLLAAMHYRAPLSKPLPPVLLLCSRGDALVDARCSHSLAVGWQCDFAEHPDAGHDLPLDDGPWVAAAVRRWLARDEVGRDR